jgi:DNA-binding NtrC family response regulator
MGRHDPILIVDAEQKYQDELSAAFGQAGYSTCIALNVKEAFSCLQSCLFCLVLLEIELPGMSGMCILAMMRRLYPDLPVLVYTGCADTGQMVQALRAGARGYLLKPLYPARVLECVNQLMLERDKPVWEKKFTQAVSKRIVGARPGG